MNTHRFLQVVTGIVVSALFASSPGYGQVAPKVRLDPTTIAKYQSPLIIPPAMPKTSTRLTWDGKTADYYEIAVRQFQQQILPPGMPLTTVWSYGSVQNPATFNYPAFTIEAQYNKPVIVKWVNDLVDAGGNYLPHLFPVDQTLHWANPAGGIAGRDSRTTNPAPYTGPVPFITHVHGAHVNQESDGYPQAWYLPNALNIPAGYATTGSDYEKNKALSHYWSEWTVGSTVFDYPNDQRAATLWYHDHTMGMTRLNVMAGPAGFYLLRGGPDDVVMTTAGTAAVLPNPAPGVTMPPAVYEIPIAIQDRAFNTDGSLAFPDSRAAFDGFLGPYIGDPAGRPSDISPIWNPEYFGDTIVVNGRTWPFLNVEQRRYRFRFLNGCNARALILKLSNGLPFWQIGAEQGFLAQPVQLNQLLLANAERADVIVDFTNVPVGTNVVLQNIGPDMPFGGGTPGVGFAVANPLTTGEVMQFRVVASTSPDLSTPPAQLALPVRTAMAPQNIVRQVSLNELKSALLTDPLTGLPIGPMEARLGTVDLTSMPGMPMGMAMMWMHGITENPIFGDTETWEIYNFTMDAHPIHLHQVAFEVINREVWDPMYGVPGTITAPETWESGTKDTVIVYPGQITRVKATFDLPGRYVWHCHIVDHEDNEMMRPYEVIGKPLAEIAANLDANPAEDLVVNFGPTYGTWVYYNNATWTQLHTLSPESMTTADLDGNGISDLVMDFGPAHGIWVYSNNTNWAQIHNISPESITSADLDNNMLSDLVVDFGPTYGVWVYYNNSNWVKLHALSPDSIVRADLDANLADDLVIDFGGQGIWVYMNNSNWIKLHNVDPLSVTVAKLDANAIDDLVVDFGPTYGIWTYVNNAAWSKLHNLSSMSITSADLNNDGLSDLVINFGTSQGIWVYYSNGVWLQLHYLSPKSIVAANIDNIPASDLIVDFGPKYGIWVYYNNSSWQQLHNVSP
jgi:bilirubin oxidase